MAIRSFTDLEAWKEGHKLVLLFYDATKRFPTSEKFGLINQIRRAAVSVTSNIAEGFSRNGVREKVQFYYMALGSLTELQNQTIISRDLKYLSREDFGKISEQSIIVSKLINGIIKSAKKFAPRA